MSCEILVPPSDHFMTMATKDNNETRSAPISAGILLLREKKYYVTVSLWGENQSQVPEQ